MSPGKTPPADVLALSIISAVGCGISILCLLLTVILHFIVWRFVKSDRAVLLLNLCAALIISYIVFLAGVDRVENKDVCTAVSALLHYFYLVVFFLMLAYGIEIAISVVYVFVTRSRIKWLLPLAWGIPLVIVGISMGVTKLEGYGNESFCWLSIEDGLLWAFVGPAALIIVINFIIVVIVLRQMFKSSAMMTKSDKEKAVMGVRSICVLLPILGLTWVFGIFSVNEDLVVFQYIFAICNSLQGFLIFLFHCILNKQLRQAIKQRSDRKKSLQSIENTFKNPHSTTGSTAFLSNENKLQQNKDLNTGSTNPFLEADRQMKELVGKNKKSTNLNDNFEANNKVEVDNRSKAVDLDDVKISNIIRESEVMGGTAGISSILPADNRTEDDKINETPMFRSQISSGSHRYDYIDPREGPGKNSPPQTVGIEKPPGYEKLLQATGLANYASKDSVHSGSDRSREKEKQREKEREKERERERERQRKIEKEKLDRIEKEKKEREKMERENEERERKEREQRDKSKYHEGGVIRIGYTNEGYNTSATVDRRREGSQERSQPRSGRSSRTDDDYESGSSAQNVTSINTALPEKFEFYQGKKRQQKEAKKHSESSLKKKDKKKSSLKDRSKAYEYSYESTYLGGNSRHASLENMNMQNLGYSPYAQMPGYGGYPTGRPAVQQQHWDQYAGYARGPREPRTPRDPRDYDPYARDPYRRDYW
ncbi:cadherin EGF LAG seven-pass G-type receptor 1-like isoform X3 [Ruditapes philippinarum]|uniref:cadherin EGF LAG seven-pass G-type receptor 1-like isoform X3 n=1 Tax=Ruditapes philippinarum TaxID=129788 RepID=UPI00295BA561|nr:cadherin EGF LAG seven-pass G-type receptor 1-like isoform X3 [Ruditapes philippinarum]